jgi:hypothetical protein
MPKPTRTALAACAVLALAYNVAHADTTVTPTRVFPQASTALETSHVVPGGVKALHGVSVNTTVAGGWFMILNAAADPGNGPVTPLKWIQVGANQTAGLTADPDTMWAFPLGVVLVFSTTGPFTETQSATVVFSWQ